MKDDCQSGLPRKVEYPVQSGILDVGRSAGDFAGDHFFFDGKLPYPAENPWEGQKHVFDVIHGPAVGGVEADNHGVEHRFLIRLQGRVLRGDDRIDGAVVVEGLVVVEVVGRRNFCLHVPALLERNAENGGTHDPLLLQDGMGLGEGDPLLDVVAGVEVYVRNGDFVLVHYDGLGGVGARAGKEENEKKQKSDGFHDDFFVVLGEVFLLEVFLTVAFLVVFFRVVFFRVVFLGVLPTDTENSFSNFF